MSDENIERILATYPPVKDKPGYVWVDKYHYIKLENLREEYEQRYGVNEIS